MICESCGNVMPEDAKYCNMCGAEVVVEDKEEVVEPIEVVVEEVVEEAKVEVVPTSKVKEAVKYISFIGIILAAVGAFLNTVTYTYGGKEISEEYIKTAPTDWSGLYFVDQTIP